MNSIIDKYIKIFQIKSKDNRDKLYNFSVYLKNKKNKITVHANNRFEIEKTKLELKKKYISLGKYVFKKKNTENVHDFSYDDNYIQLNNEIKKIVDYINSISNK